jgi:hypothetical protein
LLLLCSHTYTLARYRLKLLKPSEKALALSAKVSIRINGWGYLSIKYLVQTDYPQPLFIEYLVRCMCVICLCGVGVLSAKVSIRINGWGFSPSSTLSRPTDPAALH